MNRFMRLAVRVEMLHMYFILFYILPHIRYLICAIAFIFILFNHSGKYKNIPKSKSGVL